jgi:hypothetical protein
MPVPCSISSSPAALDSPNTGESQVEVDWFVLAKEVFSALTDSSPSNATVEFQTGRFHLRLGWVETAKQILVGQLHKTMYVYFRHSDCLG